MSLTPESSTRLTRAIFALSLLVCAVFASAGAFAAVTPSLNVTFRETVFQNVTFAKDFYLTENRTYSLIIGNVTIENPNNVTVYDTYLRVVNTDYLASNFTYIAGRQGYQPFYTKTNNATSTLTGTISSTALSLGDIDEDDINDTVTVNATHIAFNISSQYAILSYRLYNTSGVANLAAVNQVFNYTFNVTSTKVDGNYEDSRVFATLRVNGTEATASQLNGSQVTLTLTDAARNFTVLFIPELRPGQYTTFNYSVSSLYVDPPLDINTTYTNPLYQTKVLAGQYFAVTDVATNIAQVGALTIVNITINSLGVNMSNGTQWQIFNFSLHNLSNTGDFQYVYGNGTNPRVWSWVTNNGTIPVGNSYNISYYVQAPDTVPTSGTYAAVQENLTYYINATASRVGVDDIRARADINFSVSKQIISPQDNLSNNNVTWRAIPVVQGNAPINYTLEKVTLWVTSTIDPNAIANSLNTTYTVNTGINQASGWAGTEWLFNFTDGSDNLLAPPPIVWIKPYWIITNQNGQILNQSLTQNGTDLYVKYIYVVNGYWLNVEKNITNTANNSYRIQVHVQNIGNGHTPQNLTVTVYDFIPDEFTPYSFSPNFNNASNVTGQFNGTAYQWDVGLRTNLSTSFAPAGDASGYDNYYLNYSVNGTGSFRVSELYIVGLDPRKVDNANSFEGVSILSGIASTSKELIYLGIVVFLIAINIGNFLMTSRINKKLDKKE